MHKNDSEEMSQTSLGSSGAPLETPSKSFPELGSGTFVAEDHACTNAGQLNKTGLEAATDPNTLATLVLLLPFINYFK